ncbi:tripartite motif-containing protein 3-like [Branchiostoma floridae]|uniref:Tripartite motif-containing protein 3-like n=1 Tax=Branchiostoma floridae TaxID=7739 RepID=A0A9J7KG89_BRAFL|nr:tripartite motif-containing protein 3-like [Branchiostoma floridae]
MVTEKNEKLEKIILEQNEKIQQLQEFNKKMEARIEELMTAKQPVESLNRQKDLLHPMSYKHSIDKSKATNTAQVNQSVVQPKRKDIPFRALREPMNRQKIKLENLQLEAANKQSVVLPKRKDIGINVRSIRVGQPWVRKVRFGGGGSGKGKFRGPFGVAVSQDNEVYIADWDNSRIQVFTMDGVYIREFTTTLPGETGEELNPHDVAVDRNGNLWVVGHGHVVQYSSEGTYLGKIDLRHVTNLSGIAIAMATEQVIVTDGQSCQLRVFYQDGSDLGTYGSGHRSPETWCPQYVTVDGEGNILVTDINNHCVHVLGREGNFKFKFGSEGSDESQLKYPEGICIDGMGNIIVADTGSRNGCVKMFDSQGRFLCHIESGYPRGVAMSPGGDVVVTDYVNNTVSVWTQG